MLGPILAAVDVEALPISEWITPALGTTIVLALLLFVANQRGLWVSGREHKAQAEQYEKRLTEAEERRKSEADARLKDAAVLGQVTQAMRTAGDFFSEIEHEWLRDADAYRERLGSGTSPGGRSRRRPATARGDDGGG